MWLPPHGITWMNADIIKLTSVVRNLPEKGIPIVMEIKHNPESPIDRNKHRAPRISRKNILRC